MIVSSARRLSSRREADKRRTQREWQAAAWANYHTIPEAWYASQFHGRALGTLDYEVGVIQEDGSVKRDESPEVQAQLDRLRDADGSLGNIASSYGRQTFVAGEGFLFGYRDAEGEDEIWEMLSTQELRVVDGGFKRKLDMGQEEDDYTEVPADQGIPKQLEVGTAIGFRFWQRDPEYSQQPDSPMRATMDVCEELKTLTLAIMSRATNRAANNGVLLIPEEMTDPPLEAAPDEDPAEDPFLTLLDEHLNAPMRASGSAGDATPLVIRMPQAMIEFVKFITITPNTDSYPEVQLRTEAIGRFATGIDMPRELLLGLADSNHWTAWQIDEQTWKVHLQPAADRFITDLSHAYLRPALVSCLGMAPDDAKLRVIVYNEAAIVNHPDRSTDADKAYDRYAISWEAYRAAKGFEETDAPSPEEVQQRTEIIAATRGRQADAGQIGDPTPPSDATQTNDAAGTDETPPTQPNGAQASAGGLSGAIYVAMHRCRELAGSRLRNKARAAGIETILNVPNDEVPSVLGLRVSEGLSPDQTPAQLVAGGAACMAKALGQLGYGDDAIRHWIEQVEAHSAATLFDAEPDPIPVA